MIEIVDFIATLILIVIFGFVALMVVSGLVVIVGAVLAPVFAVVVKLMEKNPN